MFKIYAHFGKIYIYNLESIVIAVFKRTMAWDTFQLHVFLQDEDFP